jgi:glucosamine kinase
MSDGGVVLGIDGGGSVTRVFCADLSGNIRGFTTSGGAHPGKNPSAAANVQQGIRAVLHAAGSEPGEVRAIVAGIAGYNSLNDESWAVALTDVPGLSCPRRHINDAVVAHAGAFGLEPGIIAISGTGSIVFGITETGRQVRNYDFRHFPSTSARGIGFDAVFRILIGEDTDSDIDLVRSVLDYWEVTYREALRELASGNDRGDYAEITRRYGEIAPLITHAAQKGSPLAQRVCESAASELCVGIRLVGSCFASTVSAPLAVALIGSVIHSDYMSAAVSRHLASVALPRPYQIVKALREPGIGAVALALNEAGVTITPSIHSHLLGDAA